MPKTAWCHVPDSQDPREICIDSAGVADHQQHPKDYAVKTFYKDGDGDGYGAGPAETGCVVPAGYVERDGDCSDTNAAINPGATEVCDGVDNDCDGQVDEGVQTTFYKDGDSDTYGGTTTQLACTAPTGFVERDGDCNDANAATNPGATEVCDSVDNNCDGNIDEGNVCVPATCPCNALYDQAIQAWVAARGPLAGQLLIGSPQNIQCHDSGPAPSDTLTLATEAFGPAGTGCYAVARVNGVFLVNTLIPATQAEKIACGPSVQSRCTP